MGNATKCHEGGKLVKTPILNKAVKNSNKIGTGGKGMQMRCNFMTEYEPESVREKQLFTEIWSNHHKRGTSE